MQPSVIIAGGGMAGTLLALALDTLSQGRVRIDVIEAQLPQAMSGSGFDARCIALAHGSCQQLEQLGLWAPLATHAAPIRRIHVSDRGHAGRVQLDAADYALPALGQVVELRRAGEALLQLLAKRPSIHWHCPACVRDVQRDTERVTVTLDNGQALQAQLLVAADGTHSQVLAQCGIRPTAQPYEQVAVIANVRSAVAHQGQAFERFTAHGPLALLPLATGDGAPADNLCSLVWCHPSAQRESVLAWDDATFLQQLQQAFGWRLGRFTAVGERHAYPLALYQHPQHAHHRLALVGNAAQTLHPIAGQGFNLGLRDVMALAQTLADALPTNAENTAVDIGDYQVLRHYQRRRRDDQQTTIDTTDGLVRLFANRYAPLVAGRNTGLLLMQALTPWRDQLARRMLGESESTKGVPCAGL
ncbi:2-octaprenyl-6-methoxyphenyl hydroxylase [Plesiomonas shigelloides]|uniref:2-octaprenyl-6-methoxyphenyl hydroxylase n=1 Tax=Plesiomonas shigelloides TaxID=703 RepID=UPI002FC8E757